VRYALNRSLFPTAITVTYKILSSTLYTSLYPALRSLILKQSGIADSADETFVNSFKRTMYMSTPVLMQTQSGASFPVGSGLQREASPQGIADAVSQIIPPPISNRRVSALEAGNERYRPG